MSSYGYLFLLLFSEESESKEQQLQNISRWFPTPKCSIKEGAKQVLYDDVCAAEVSTTTWTMIIIMIMRDGCSSRNFFPDITQSCIFIRLLVFKLNSRIIPRIPGLFILFTKRGENPLRVCKNSTSVSLLWCNNRHTWTWKLTWKHEAVWQTESCSRKKKKKEIKRGATSL